MERKIPDINTSEFFSDETDAKLAALLEESDELSDPEEIESHRSIFTAYFESAIPGSPRLLALYDYIGEIDAGISVHECKKYIERIEFSEQLDEDSPDKYGPFFDEETKMYEDHPLDYASRLEYESDLRLAELLLVNVKSRIQEREASVPGYFVHKDRISEWHTKLGGIVEDLSISNPKIKEEYETDGYDFMKRYLRDAMLITDIE